MQKESITVLVLAFLTASASADSVVNGNFETGDLTGWTVFHHSGHPDDTWPAFGASVIPGTGPDGTHAALIMTEWEGAQWSGADGRLSGILGTSVRTANVAAMWQSVTLHAGDRLEFDWRFVTQEPWAWDIYGVVARERALVLVDGMLIELDNANSAFFAGRLTFDNSVVPGSTWMSDWYRFSFPALRTSTFDLAFIATEGGHMDGSETGMLIDNIQVIRAGDTDPVVIPLPLTAWAGLALLGLLGAHRWMHCRSHRCAT